jgi:CRP-like cAMP-binding protein
MVARDEKIELLKTVPLFRGLGNSEMQRIGQLVDEVDLPAGRVLMRQGDSGAELFAIVDGSASVERDGRQLPACGPGSVIGEIALIDGGPRTATVTLTAPSRLLVLSRRDFGSLMDEFPGVRIQILDTLASRVRSLEESSPH